MWGHNPPEAAKLRTPWRDDLGDESNGYTHVGLGLDK